MIDVFVLVMFSAFFLYFGVPWIYGRCNRVLLRRRAIRSRALVLTLDDGPGNHLTPEILEILKKHELKATFFLLGRSAAGREAIVRQISAGGHEIGSHGYEHLHYWKVSPFRAIADIKRGWKTIDEALGEKRRVYPFRPPYGKLNLFCLLYLWFHGVPICYWTLDSSDIWPSGKPDSRRSARLAAMAGGAVLLVHDFDRHNRDRDRMVIDSINSTLAMAKENGMRVMPLEELRRVN